MNKKTYYLAYGSNLSTEQMAVRCPDAMVAGKAVLKDWKLAFKYHADIIPCEGELVQVLVWQISEQDEENLDYYEGFPHYYCKKLMNVTMTDFNGDHPEEITAMVYVMSEGNERLRMPAKGYYDVLANAYRKLWFDERYLQRALLESIDSQRGEHK